MAYYVLEMHYRKPEYHMKECKTVEALREYLLKYCEEHKDLLCESDFRTRDENAFWDQLPDSDDDDLTDEILAFAKTISNEGLVRFVKRLGDTVTFKQEGFGIVEVIGGVRF